MIPMRLVGNADVTTSRLESNPQHRTQLAVEIGKQRLTSKSSKPREPRRSSDSQC
jgi:hypothetical protein